MIYTIFHVLIEIGLGNPGKWGFKERAHVNDRYGKNRNLGYYFSPKGEESPKHKKPCKVIDNEISQLRIQFKNPGLGRDSVNNGKFIADPKAEFATTMED